MNASIDGFLAALAHSSAAAGVLVLLVLALQALLRPLLSPRWQCALWLIVIARLVPFSLSSEASLFNLLPRWQAFAHPEPKTAATPPKLPASLPVLVISPAAPDLTARQIPAPTAAPEFRTEQAASAARDFWTWSTFLFFGWLAGAAALGGYVVLASVSLARSLRRLSPLEDPAVLARLEDCCRQVGVRRAPGLIVSESVGTPALRNMGTLGGNLGQRIRCWYFRGGVGCFNEDDRPTDRRRLYHHFTFYGFALCFASTSVASCARSCAALSSFCSA